MSASADAVVIGGGEIGASTAFHLARAGVRRVMLFERAFIGAGATGKSHSIVRMHDTNPDDADLARASLPYLQHWGDLVGSGDCGFIRTGVFRFANQRETHRIHANVEMLCGLGVNTSVVDAIEIQTIDPGLNVSDLLCAAWEPESGYADPLPTANGFASATTARGGSIQEGVHVTRILTDGGRVTGVETAEGIVATGTVAVANGAWSPALLTPLGFDVPLVPKRVQIVVFRRPRPIGGTLKPSSSTVRWGLSFVRTARRRRWLRWDSIRIRSIPTPSTREYQAITSPRAVSGSLADDRRWAARRVAAAGPASRPNRLTVTSWSTS